MLFKDFIEKVYSESLCNNGQDSNDIFNLLEFQEKLIKKIPGYKIITYDEDEFILDSTSLILKYLIEHNTNYSYMLNILVKTLVDLSKNNCITETDDDNY